MNQSGVPILVAALILGGSILGASAMIVNSLGQNAAELASLRGAVEEMADARPPSRPARQARRGLDPSRRYSVDIDGAPTRGPEDAKVTVVEFSDFQCPFCKRVTPTLDQIEKEYGDDVRFVFKHLPLSIHPKAPAAHAAAEAAHRQGKFWEMHDRIFSNQPGMSPELYRQYAEEIGLDMEQYDREFAAAETRKRVDADLAEAEKLGVTGTPAFFVNGRFLSGAQPFPNFKRLIDEELEKG